MIRRFLRPMVVAAGLAAISCNVGNSGANDANHSDPNLLRTQRQAVSECQGFGDALPFGAVAVSSTPSAYCDAETLAYRYDAATAKLTLYHRRVSLNCCGEHGATVAVERGVYMVVETDEPKANVRCRCMCVFDFAVQVDDIPAETIPLAVQLDVTDEPGGPREVWSGALDLTKGSGEFVLSTDAVMGCEQ